MLRLIKSDLYRLFHIRLFYFILVAILMLAGVVIVSGHFSTIGGITQEIDTALSISNRLKWDVNIAFKSALSVSSALNFLFIGVFMIIFGHEFSQKTYQNTLTSGISRITFIFSKFVTQLMIVTLGTTLYLGSALSLSVLKYGILGINIVELIKEVLFASLSVSLGITVILSFAVILLIVFSSSVLASTFIVAYPYIIQVMGFSIKWDTFDYLDLLRITQKMGFEDFSGTDLIPYIVVNTVLIVVLFMVSAGLMKHKAL